MAISIILGIVIVLFIIAGIASSVMFKADDNGIAATISILLTFALIVAFFTVPFSIHTIDTGEVAVVKHLGKIKEVKTAGTHYDLWVTNKYSRYDAKVRTVDIETSAYSSDAQTMSVNMTIQYQIMSDSVIDIATHYGAINILEDRITSVATEKAKSALSTRKAMDIISNRSAISPEVEKIIPKVTGGDTMVGLENLG